MQGLTTQDLERLKRVSVTGAGSAEQALRQMTSLPVGLHVSRVQMLGFPDVAALLGGPEAPVVAVHMKVYGDCRAGVLLAMSPATTVRILAMLFPPGIEDLDEMGEMERSGLTELGNIVTCAYLNALSDELRLSLIPSVPSLAYDMAGAVLDSLLIEQGQRADAALVVQSEMGSTAGLTGNLLLLPDPASLPKILETIREPYTG